VEDGRRDVWANLRCDALAPRPLEPERAEDAEREPKAEVEAEPEVTTKHEEVF
jgi:hypothetical protein